MKIEAAPNTKKISMPRRLFRKWLRALRSGEYDKATNYLTNNDGTGFCCLGVLANEQGCTWSHNGYKFVAPIPKGGRAQKSEAFLGRALAAGLPIDLQEQLADFNDARGGNTCSHSEIADWLEANITPTK